MFTILTDSADYSVGMALVDFFPVILFFLAGLIMLRDYYNKLYKGNYALLCTGIVMIFTAGFCKALWKILVACNVCDYTLLNLMFIPFQGIGMTFYGIALLGVIFVRNKPKTVTASAVWLPLLLLPILQEVKVVDTKMPFIILQVLGCTLADVMLFLTAFKMHGLKKRYRVTAMILFVVSFITMLGMGYLSAKFKTGATEWAAELVNTVSQGSLLAAMILLHIGGLKHQEAFKDLNKVEI